MARAQCAAGVAVNVLELQCCRQERQTGAPGSSFFRSTSSPSVGCPRRVCQRRQASVIRAARPPPQGSGTASKIKEGRRTSQKEKSLEGWTEVAMSLDIEEGKNKATIHDGKGYVVVKSGEELYGIDANCASCKFPVIEGKVTMTSDGRGPQIECPLCHSKFLLSDGTVTEYCPKDGPMQWVVGTLKEKAPQENTQVYPARMSKSGRVYLQFAREIRRVQ